MRRRWRAKPGGYFPSAPVRTSRWSNVECIGPMIVEQFDISSRAGQCDQQQSRCHQYTFHHIPPTFVAQSAVNRSKITWFLSAAIMLIFRDVGRYLRMPDDLKGKSSMKSAAVLSVVVLCAFASPAFAQNAVGGSKSKSNVVGGPVKQTSPVMPVSKTGSAPISPPSTSSPPKAASASPKVTSAPPKVTSLPPRPTCPNGLCASKK